MFSFTNLSHNFRYFRKLYLAAGLIVVLLIAVLKVAVPFVSAKPTLVKGHGCHSYLPLPVALVVQAAFW